MRTLTQNSLPAKIVLVAFLTAFCFLPTSYSQIVIEAENYTAMKGIQTEVTSDDGGGINVGYIDNTDWMDYTLSIPLAGQYRFSFRCAGQNSGSLQVKEGDRILETIAIASSGGWQNWKTIEGTLEVTLNEGTHTIRLLAAPGGYNLNWWKITLVNPQDTDKPTKPLIASAKADVHSVALTWHPSNDTSSAVAGYEILKDDKLFAYTTDTFLRLTKLPPNQTFVLSLRANDLAGNYSTPTSASLQTDTLPWDLAWSDEFDYTGAPNPELWNNQVGGDGWGNGEAQYYTNGENTQVANGVLTIEARKEKRGNNEFTSARINTSGKGDFLFGRIEVRAKLPKTGGTWPAIWTLPTEWLYGGWPHCGEIDIMEHSATYGYGDVFGTIHTGAYNHILETQKSGGLHYADVSDTFHTYAMEWYPDHLDWYYDDQLVFSFENEYKSTEEWPFDLKHHLLLNVAIGGGLGGNINSAGVWPQQMIVDYVRAYDFKLGVNDTLAPEAPQHISAHAKWSSAEITWYLAKDNYAIEKYYIYKHNVLIDSVRGTQYLMSGLSEQSSYNIGIQAADYAGNRSEISTLDFTTPEISGIAVPGKIQAENYTDMSGIDTQACEDTGGGINVGWIDAGDWMSYTIDVKEAMEFRAAFRVAGQSASGALQLHNEAGSEIIPLDFSVSGGWQSWKTVFSPSFTLPLGIQTITLKVNQGGFNLNWFEIKDKNLFTGISASANHPLRMYPNPLQGNTLKIELPNNEAIMGIKLYSSEGKLLMQKTPGMLHQQYEINALNLTQGVYILSVTGQHFVYTQTLEVL